MDFMSLCVSSRIFINLCIRDLLLVDFCAIYNCSSALVTWFLYPSMLNTAVQHSFEYIIDAHQFLQYHLPPTPLSLHQNACKYWLGNQISTLFIFRTRSICSWVETDTQVKHITHAPLSDNKFTTTKTFNLIHRHYIHIKVPYSSNRWCTTIAEQLVVDLIFSASMSWINMLTSTLKWLTLTCLKCLIQVKTKQLTDTDWSYIRGKANKKCWSDITKIYPISTSTSQFLKQTYTIKFVIAQIHNLALQCQHRVT